jgi:hypothetical protein
MTFEEEFPSLKDKISQMQCIHCGQWTGISLLDVKDYCFDKQRVKDAWDKLMDRTDDLHNLECGSCDTEVQEFIKELNL